MWFKVSNSVPVSMRPCVPVPFVTVSLCQAMAVPLSGRCSLAVPQGCQVRRETAHSESVCCHNVRALFDELPTPHLELEITVFPAGPLTNARVPEGAEA